MRRIPSPVTVVTAAGGGQRRGITIGSFVSVSLDPPLISFNVSRDAQMHPLIVEASLFAVHILTGEQAYLSNHFAIPDLSGEEQFASVAYHLDDDGTPILEDVLAVFFCRRYAVYDAGDHSLLLGQVLNVTEQVEGNPLLYFDRSYRRVGEKIEAGVFTPMKRVSSDTP